MARQPKQPTTTVKTCPACGELEALRRERRPGKWLWRCTTEGCEHKQEGKR